MHVVGDTEFYSAGDHRPLREDRGIRSTVSNMQNALQIPLAFGVSVDLVQFGKKVAKLDDFVRRQIS